MTYFLLLISIFVWPYGQLLTFQLPYFPATIYLLDFTVGLLTLSLLFSAKSRKQIAADYLFKPLLIFLAVASLSLLLNISGLPFANVAIALFYLARLFIYPSLYFAVKQIGFTRIKLPILLAFSIFCVLGVAQYLLMPDMRFLKLIGFDDHYYRLIGSFFDPNFTGALLAGVALYLITKNKWLPAVILTMMLAATFSRASYLSFAAGLIFILIKRKKLIYLAAIALLLLAVFLVPKPFGEGVNLARTVSIFSRLESWKMGINLFLQKPIFGWGYNTLRIITGDRFQTDNSFIYIAATTGIVGLTTFLNLLYKSLKRVSDLPTQAFLLAVLTHSLFNNSLFFIWIFFSFWFALGLSAKEYKQS